MSTAKQVEFTGSGIEYTKLWLTNFFLSIITLGIYSAWAKVRNNQYLYGHTNIDGDSFKYTAKPVQILIGRLIAVALFLIYSISSYINVAFGTIVFSLLILAMPWLMVLGLRFDLRNTTFRNVRFHFHGNIGRAYLLALIAPFIYIFTFGLGGPWVHSMFSKYLYNNIGYGKREFSMEPQVGEFYIAMLVGMGIGIGAIVLAVIIAFATSFSLPKEWAQLVVLPVTLIYIIGIVMANAAYRVLIRNHVFSQMGIDNVVQLKSNVSFLRVALVELSNIFILIFTLGLGYGYTVVRRLKVYAEGTQVEPLEQYESVLDEEQREASAVGEETAEVFDVGISILT